MKDFGEVHEAKLPVAAPGPSRRHSKLELASLEVRLKLGSLFEVGPSGPEVIEVLGAAVSTVKERVWVAVLPAASVALTRKVYEPSARGRLGVCDELDEQAPKLELP